MLEQGRRVGEGGGHDSVSSFSLKRAACAQKMAFSKSSNFQEASLNFLMPHPIKYKLAWSSLGGQGTPVKKKTGEGAEADL